MAAKKSTKNKSQSATTTVTSAASAEQVDGVQRAEITEMLQLAKLEYLKSLKSKIIKEKRREIDSLDQQIKEFLGPYMLIGYDLNDQPVEMFSADSQTHYDALLERFRRLMFKINQNMVNSNGEDPYGNGRADQT